MSSLACLTDTIVMVPPTSFSFNEEAALTNIYQNKPSDENYVQNSLNEFNAMVNTLSLNGIRVIILPSKQDTPDAVFPNNWFSVSHYDDYNELNIYPMLNANRRNERQLENLLSLLKMNNINISIVTDFSYFEQDNQIVEGTGSLCIDHKNKVIFASKSLRTNSKTSQIIANKFNYELNMFSSYDVNGNEIYHTNVVLCIGYNFAILADCTIPNLEERTVIYNRLKSLKKDVISLTYDQVSAMCGNVIQLRNKDNESKIIMSKTAYHSFTSDQMNVLKAHGEVIAVDVTTIETIGGGSARCMIAEIYY